ncbi:MAG: shikimate dehydrogenase [Bacteroidetes bacterium]|nr:shikimate dehydrogenase [Bacteroidota bacterium]
MKRFGLAGYPLGHSFSASYFNDKFRNLNLTECEYVNYPVREAADIRCLFENDIELNGLNVTIPFKTSVIRVIDVLDRSAEAAGAVNVVKPCRSAGRLTLKGFNTDIPGFRESLPSEYLSGGGLALVFGTGGASMAIDYVLNELGYSTMRVSREAGRGDLTYYLVTGELIRKTRIIVNTTPAGMYPDTDEKPPFNSELLTGSQFIYDLIYNPAETLFLKEGRMKGCKTMNGLTMLHLQADRAWGIWNDPAL